MRGGLHASLILVALIGAGAPAAAQAPGELEEPDQQTPDIDTEGLPQAPVDTSEAEGVDPGQAEVDRTPDAEDREDVPEPLPSGSVPTPQPGDAPLPEMPAEGELDAQRSLPGQARSVTVEEQTRRGYLWIPRILFAPVRFSIWLVTRPLIALGKLNRKYQLVARFASLFVSDDGTYGLVPAAFVETGFGLNAGVRAFHRDLFGHGESISARASFGGFYNQRYQLAVSTGRLSPHVTVEAGVRYVVRKADRFFGVGTADLVDSYDVALPLSVYDDEYAVRSRYRRRTLVGELALRFPIADRIWIRASNQWTWSRFDQGGLSQDDPWLAQAFDNEDLVGYFQPQTNASTELRLVVDRRVQESTYIAPSLPSGGAWLQTWGAWQQGVREDPSQFGRVGADLDGFVNLWNHDRILRIRTRFEAIVGKKENIPFDGWSLLEGPDLLRGFSRQRFRSRYAGLATLEYRYPISSSLMGFLFTDTGIVFNQPEEAHPRDWHFGYGGGVILFSKAAFIARVQVAASREGVFFNLRLAPANEPADVL